MINDIIEFALSNEPLDKELAFKAISRPESLKVLKDNLLKLYKEFKYNV